MTTEKNIIGPGAERPLNRLKTMYELRAYVDSMYEDSREAEDEGRPVAWCMLSIPTQILTAMGFEAVFPENYGTICASSGAAAPFLERAESEGFPNHMCGYCRNGLGYAARMADLDGKIPPEAPGGGLARPDLLVGSGAVCDARYKFFQALGRYLNVPVYIIEAPAAGQRESLKEGAYEHTVQFLIREYKQFVVFLEKFLDKKMDWDKIGSIQGTKELDKVWWDINQLRRERPCPMNSRDFWSSMSGALYKAGDVDEMTVLYRKMYDEVKNRVDRGIAGINREEKYRLTFQGLPPWHSLGFFDQLADRGWNFVHESSYHPARPVDIDVSHINDPMERYVRSNSRSLAAIIDRDFEPEEAAEIKKEILRQGYSHRLAAKNVREFKCDGAFLHPMLTCRAFTAPLFLYQKQIMDVYKVPSLILEGDIVDLTLFDPVAGLKKAEAFEEIMDYYKEVRKKEGLDW
ncbi:MAG: 2-hydroxyacyl-CoA dehydratase [Dehalococcoidales bacterium]|nr:MAG: 2-hydroxyacyl-CoA dehydratase [Dehalococcoidales bacterium]